MFQNRYLFIFSFFVGILFSQPKFSIGMDVGYYKPGMSVSSENQLPQASGFSADILPGYSMFYQFFPGARVGFSHSFSIHIDQTKSGTPFSRIFSYRMFILETFFLARERLEWNFSLAPTWNKGSIHLDAKENFTEWDTFLTGFNDTQGPISVISSDQMTTYWFGFASFIGLRYYIRSWCAIDIKTGFMNNYYDNKNWKFQGKKVVGPEMTISGEPIVTVKVIFGW